LKPTSEITRYCYAVLDVVVVFVVVVVAAVIVAVVVG